MNDNLKNRIFNGKFRQTLQYAKKESKTTKELLQALENILGNIGWFHTKEDIEEWVCWEDVSVKDLQTVLKHALMNIGCEKEILSMFYAEESTV